MKEFYLLRNNLKCETRSVRRRERNYISLNILLVKKIVAKTAKTAEKKNTCRTNESENCYISHMIERFVSSTSG